MVNPTINAAATASLEAAINKALQYDPGTQQALAQLQGKSLAVDLTDLNTSLCYSFEEDSVRVTSQVDDPTVRLRGSVVGLVRLATSDTVNLSEANVEAWGNTAMLADIKTIASNIDIDWEDAINNWLGDIAGHQIAEQIRWRLGWLAERGKNAKRLVQEFLTEELSATPSKVELQNFSEGVDKIRLTADRLEAKLAAAISNTQNNKNNRSDDELKD